MHDPDEPCFAEDLLDVLMPTMIRAGIVSAEMLMSLADQLDDEARTANVERTQRLEEMAAALRTWSLDAAGTTRADWQAEQRRKGFRVIDIKGRD